MESLNKFRKDNIDLDILLKDFDAISYSREYNYNGYPMYIPYVEIKSYIDLKQSKTLLYNKDYSDDSVSEFVSYIVDLDRFFVNNKRRKINQERKQNKTSKG